MQLTRVDDPSDYCPECLVCVSANRDECPECGSSNLKPLELCTQPYLGYVLDGRYLLDRYLGGGASGEVYRAVDRKLQRPFALKIVELGSYGGDEEERREKVRRFRNEVQALSRLRNPHVINIFESFELDTDVSALLTQYIDGVTLDAMMDQGPMPFGRALTIMRQVANGLHEAHEQGVVHRDVKPGNIMIEQLPAAGIFARLLDFGLVHLVDDASHTRGFRGTPLYAAPEQCTSKRQVDRRADIYALGAVLFHIVTGRPPFDGSTAVAIIESHCRKQAPKLSDHAPGSVPAQLDDLVEAALRKDPDDRPQTLRAFIRVLDSIGAEQHSYIGPASAANVGRSVGTEPTAAVDAEQNSGGLVEPTAPGSALASSSAADAVPAELVQEVVLDDYLDSFATGSTAVRMDRESRCIVLADGAHRVHMVSRGERMYNDTFEGASMRLTGVAAQLERGGIFASEMNGRILRWGIDGSGTEPETVHQFVERILALDVERNGTRVVVGSERGNILSFDVRTNQTKSHGQLEPPICDVRIAPGGETLVAATMTGDVELLELERAGGEPSRLLSVGTEPGAVAVDDTVRWCAVLDRDGRLEVVHLEDASQSFSVEPVPPNLRSVSFSSTGQLLGITIDEEVLRIWVFHHEPLGRRGALQE